MIGFQANFDVVPNIIPDYWLCTAGKQKVDLLWAISIAFVGFPPELHHAIFDLQDVQ